MRQKLSSVSCCSLTAILACGSSPKGAERSPSSTYSTAIQMYSASCHSGCSLSLSGGGLPPRHLLLSHIVSVCSCDLPCFLNPPCPTRSDLQGPVHTVSPCASFSVGLKIYFFFSHERSQCAQAASMCDYHQI